MKVFNDAILDYCPCCRSPKIRQVGQITYSNPTFFSSNVIELEYPAYLVKCENCTSGFTQNSIKDADLIKLYTNSDSSDRWSRVPIEESKPREVITTLASCFFKDAVVADVGCNTGELLDFAKSLGAKTIGVELSKNSREIINQKGHESVYSLEQLDNQSLDVITAFDLLEHLHDPNDFLSLCRQKLKAGGKLVLLTGNINSVSARLAGKNWWYSSYPEHISFVSKKYLSKITELRLDAAIPTYASEAYKRNYLRVLISFLIRFPFGKYRGLPSLGPDHFLYVLSKV